jgi:hypothetical protein
MTRDGGEVMVTASGDVLLTTPRRYLSSPLFVSGDCEFDPLQQGRSQKAEGRPDPRCGGHPSSFCLHP